jgi:hypothetical protein
LRRKQALPRLRTIAIHPVAIVSKESAMRSDRLDCFFGFFATALSTVVLVGGLWGVLGAAFSSESLPVGHDVLAKQAPQAHPLRECTERNS